MGLLDALFDPSTYGNQSGGLLARLQPMLGQFQQGPGFPDGQPATFSERWSALPQGASFSDRFAALPNADAPSMATPMKVGNYQMPRLGSEAQYASIPTNAQPAQGQMPVQPPQQAAPPTFLNNQAGGFSAGLRGFANNLHNGPIGALIGGIGSAMGAQDPAQQNARAQYEALVPTLGPQKAMLAVLNPDAGKLLLEQALGSKQKFTEIGVDANGVKQYGFVNERDQSVKPYGSPGGNEPIAMQGPDGKIIQMPQGADPKTWRNEITRINADVAAGKKTEVQAKAEIFGNKMELANKSITDDVGTSLAGKIASGVPLGNYAQSAEYQKYKQASSNFITALLRQESGAAISKTEFDRYDREYMPQPGEGPEVLKNKAEARRVAIEGMKKGAGPGYKSPTDAATTLPSGWSVKVR